MKFKQLFKEEFLIERLSFKSMAIASLTFFKQKRIDITLDVYENNVKKYIRSYFANDIRDVSNDAIIRISLKSDCTKANPVDIQFSSLPSRLIQQVDHELEKDNVISKGIEGKYAEKKAGNIMDIILNYFTNNPKEAIEIVK